MTDPNLITAQLELIAAAIGEVLDSAQDKPEAMQLLAGALSDLHPALEEISLGVDATRAG